MFIFRWLLRKCSGYLQSARLPAVSCLSLSRSRHSLSIHIEENVFPSLLRGSKHKKIQHAVGLQTVNKSAAQNLPLPCLSITMTNTTKHTHPPVNITSVLGAPGTASGVSPGHHRSHKPADLPQQESIHAGFWGRRGDSGAPHNFSFPLQTVSYTSTQEGRSSLEIYPQFLLWQDLHTHGKRTFTPCPFHAVPLRSSPTAGSWAQKEVLDYAAFFFFLKCVHLHLWEPQISHFLFSYQATGELPLSIHWLPTRTHSLFRPPPELSVPLMSFENLKV